MVFQLISFPVEMPYSAAWWLAQGTCKKSAKMPYVCVFDQIKEKREI